MRNIQQSLSWQHVESECLVSHHGQWLSPKGWKSEKNHVINSTKLTGSPWYLRSSLSSVIFYYVSLFSFHKSPLAWVPSEEVSTALQKRCLWLRPKQHVQSLDAELFVATISIWARTKTTARNSSA